MSKHFQVLVIGGGTAGIMVSSMLKRKNSSIQIGIIEPADTHYYQPAWTLVGANTYNFEKTGRPMASLIPKGVEWIKEFADKFEPESNKVITKKGTELTYDYLVVVPGLKIAPEMIEGLKEAMDKGVVCSTIQIQNILGKY
jgi:sulfide:quinone oxidoreductase